jgi:hypothetical protein
MPNTAPTSLSLHIDLRPAMHRGQLSSILASLQTALDTAKVELEDMAGATTYGETVRAQAQALVARLTLAVTAEDVAALRDAALAHIGGR